MDGLAGGGGGFAAGVVGGLSNSGKSGTSETSRFIVDDIRLPDPEDAAAPLVVAADPINAEAFVPELVLTPDWRVVADRPSGEVTATLELEDVDDLVIGVESGKTVEVVGDGVGEVGFGVSTVAVNWLWGSVGRRINR